MSARTRRITVAVPLLAAAMFAACAQQSPRQHAHLEPPGAPAVCAPITSDAPAELQKKAGYQQIATVVKDRAGHEVRNLGKDDFILQHGDATLPVQFAEYVPNGPASVLILVDTSGSTLPKLPQTRTAIAAIVESLDPRDDVALFAFSGRPYRLQPFTRDHAAIQQQESLLHSMGPTSLYDSMIAAANALSQGCYENRVLIVISDGFDNTSSHSPGDVSDAVRSNDVTVYALAIGGTDVGATASQRSFYAPDPDTSNSIDEKSLAQFTQPAGGSTFRISPTGDADLLAAVVKSISQGSRGEYVIGFIDATKIDASTIKVGVKNHDGLVTSPRPAPKSS